MDNTDCVNCNDLELESVCFINFLISVSHSYHFVNTTFPCKISPWSGLKGWGADRMGFQLHRIEYMPLKPRTTSPTTPRLNARCPFTASQKTKRTSTSWHCRHRQVAAAGWMWGKRSTVCHGRVWSTGKQILHNTRRKAVAEQATGKCSSTHIYMSCLIQKATTSRAGNQLDGFFTTDGS